MTLGFKTLDLKSGALKISNLTQRLADHWNQNMKAFEEHTQAAVSYREL